MKEHNNYLKLKEVTVTPEQLACLNVKLLLRKVKMVDQVAESYAQWQNSKNKFNSVDTEKKSLHDYKSYALTILDSIDIGKEADAKKEIIGLTQSELTFFYKHLERTDFFIHQLRDNQINKADQISALDSLKIVYNAASNIPSLSFTQRSELFRTVGYSKEETILILKNIGISAGISTTLGTFNEQGARFAALFGFSNPFLDQINHPIPIAIVGLSYGFYYSGLILNAKQNLRLLKNKNIQISPSLLSTGIYYLSAKMVPSNIRDRGAFISSFAWDMAKELIWIGALLAPNGSSAIVSSNIFSGSKEWLQLGLAESALRLANRLKNRSNLIKK